MTTASDDIGRYGEQLAADYLVDNGFVVLDRNWRSPDRAVPGELDIVAGDGPTTVVVEVKTRRSVAFGTALDAVTPDKVSRLRRLAGLYLREVGRGGLHSHGDLRIDVVAVQLVHGAAATISHVRAVG